MKDVFEMIGLGIFSIILVIISLAVSFFGIVVATSVIWVPIVIIILAVKFI